MIKSHHLFLSLFLLILLSAAIVVLVKPSQNASIILSFPRGSTQNQVITVPLRVSTKIAANAGEFTFSFPTELLQAKDIDITGSQFTLWVKNSPSFDNQKGLLYIAGGLPTPGLTGDNQLIATVTFIAKAKGQGTISLDQAKSRILANDGQGTKIPATFVPVQFTIE